MGPDDIIRSPHAKAPLRAWPAAPPSPLLEHQNQRTPNSYLATPLMRLSRVSIFSAEHRFAPEELPTPRSNLQTCVARLRPKKDGPQAIGSWGYTNKYTAF